MKKSSQLLKFTRTCLYLARQRIPPYSSRFSQHTFNPATTSSVLLSEDQAGHYLPRVDRLAGGDAAPAAGLGLGAAATPLHTVQKAFARLSSAIWRVLQRLSAFTLNGAGIAAVDAPVGIAATPAATTLLNELS